MNLKKIHLILFLKPCYNWNTFNTHKGKQTSYQYFKVLNLIITGMHSILKNNLDRYHKRKCFKPYYKWSTFNT